MRDYCELENLEEMDTFLEMYNLPKLNKKERKYEQTNHKHRNQNCNQISFNRQKTQGQMASQVNYTKRYSSVQFSSVAQSCPTLCDPMNCSTPGLPVHHQLPEFTQTHIHRVSDAIQPSHPGSSPSPPALNPSQHQSLFQ